MERVWSAFADCWEEFESLRDTTTSSSGAAEDTDRFISGWQVRAERQSIYGILT